ncbi:MAG: nucleotidyl transferase AbiEii/AbiGii toxin family protein [Gammaproteobacteria bacterium]|nr:nucleotidyl transferase AbiEii/AbiGii toxin family protein [Gammaproteobacteria bacterium]
MTAPELAIAGNPGIVLARVAPTLLSLLGAHGCVLGGGTVLAARWGHRVSTDIDLFADHDRYQERIANRRDEASRALGAIVGQAGAGAVQVERGWLRVDLPEGPATLMTIPRPTIRDEYPETVSGTSIPTESTAEILARKVQSRILDNGVFADRDLYDLLVAAERDQEALRRVLASITVEEKAMIASELRALPRDRFISEPIREPTYPRLVPDLARRAGRLFDVDGWRGRTRR